MNKTLGLYVAGAGVVPRPPVPHRSPPARDQNSSFGTHFQRVVYPKASVSWIISDESFFPTSRLVEQLPPPERVRRVRRAARRHGRAADLRRIDVEHRDNPGRRPAPTRPGLRPTRLATPASSRSARRSSKAASRAASSATACTSTYLLQQEDARRAHQPADRCFVGHAGALGAQESRLGVELRARAHGELDDYRSARARLGHYRRRIAQQQQDPVARHRRDRQADCRRSERDDARLGRRSGERLFGRPYTYADANGDGIITPTR